MSTPALEKAADDPSNAGLLSKGQELLELSTRIDAATILALSEDTNVKEVGPTVSKLMASLLTSTTNIVYIYKTLAKTVAVRRKSSAALEPMTRREEALATTTLQTPGYHTLFSSTSCRRRR